MGYGEKPSSDEGDPQLPSLTAETVGVGGRLADGVGVNLADGVTVGGDDRVTVRREERCACSRDRGACSDRVDNNRLSHNGLGDDSVAVRDDGLADSRG